MAKTNVGSVPVVSPTPNPTAAPPPPPIAGGVGNGSTSVGTAANPPKGFRLQVLQMLQGAQSVLPAGTSVSTAAGDITQAGMVSDLQAILQAYQTVDGDGVSLKQSRQAVKTQLPGWRAEYARLRAALATFFGASSPLLAQFGLKPKAKAKPLTAAQKVARNARSMQTRKIRGTQGKTQKAKQKYTGTVNVNTDLGSGTIPAASTVPGSSPAPAQSPGSGTAAVAGTADVSPAPAPAPLPVAAPAAAPVAPGGTPPKSA